MTDVWIGYKVFKQEVLEDISLEESGFELELELTLKGGSEELACDGGADFLFAQK
ncbi:MAG: hypothetical protein MRJ67_15310 [Nitrospirales bacterium]|nr:hypothetical protein [Nitrospirales bacterium]MDR4461863.1 hypothetical protein [Nitrospirales bacterium]